MDIEKIKQYTETMILNYVKFTPDYEKIFKEQNIKINKHPKLPFIIDLDKKYSTFSARIIEEENYFLEKNVNKKKNAFEIENSEIEDYNSLEKRKPLEHNENLIILVKKSSKNIKIILNYNYFTACELLQIFKIPVIAAFQNIGHILHLNLKKEHDPFKKTIGELYYDKIKNIKTVITKTETINNEFRNLNYELLAGEDNLITIHIENNIKFYIDYANVYWNSKLQNERQILMKNFKTNETIADIFCGAGPIGIQAAIKSKFVYCNDLNPKAIECLKKSLVLNEIKNIKTFNLDARNFIEYITYNNIHIDHFIMNLPELGISYIKFLKETKNDFNLHCYFFAKTDENVIAKIQTFCYFEVKSNNLKFIRKVSPKKDMWKLTIFVEKNE
ncbi:hypothetical protein GVAV_000581 [Gurleya vavrai]